MKRKTIAVLLSVAMVLTLGCGALNILGGGSSGTVSGLWSDVPPFTGASKANLDLPLGAKIAVQAMFQGQLQFIAYTTGSSAQDVQNFYTADRMKATGWDSDSSAGCMGGATDSSSSTQGAGAFCVFGKKDNGKDTGLVVIVAQDDKTKQTQIFYVRIDLTPTPTPKS
jgi:hypothetical protein